MCLTSAFEPLEWQACNKGDIPNAHDDSATESVVDHECMISKHISYFGKQYLPKWPWLAEKFKAISRSDVAPEDGCSTREGHGMKFGRQGQQRKQITEVQGCMDSATFLNEFAYVQRPVIMRGCYSNTTAASKWTTDEYLLASDKGINYVDNHEDGWTQYIESYQKTNDYYAMTLEDVGFDILAPKLQSDLVYPPSLLSDNGGVLGLHRIMFWLNSGDQISAVHFDPHDTLLTQISHGPKQITLVDPAESHKLYADFPINPNRNDEALSYSFFGYSPVERRTIDLCTFPRIADVAVYDVTVRPGDSLFIPINWWHHVHSMPEKPTPTSRNLAVSFQGTFATFAVIRTISAAHLEAHTAIQKGCSYGEDVYVAPSEDTERCDPKRREALDRFDILPYTLIPKPMKLDLAGRVLLNPALDCVMSRYVHRRYEIPPFASINAAAKFVSSAFDVTANRTQCTTWLQLPEHNTLWSFEDEGSFILLGTESGRSPSVIVAGSTLQLGGVLPNADVHVIVSRFSAFRDELGLRYKLEGYLPSYANVESNRPGTFRRDGAPATNERVESTSSGTNIETARRTVTPFKDEMIESAFEQLKVATLSFWGESIVLKDGDPVEWILSQPVKEL